MISKNLGYIRDRHSGALVINNPDKEREIIFKRTVQDELKAMRLEIDTLKNRIRDLEEGN
jgi:hypothetical protein